MLNPRIFKTVNLRVHNRYSNNSIDRFFMRVPKDPAVNEFYEELFKHWRPKVKPVLINLDKEDDNDQGMDLSGLFSVKGEEEPEEGSGGDENVYAVMDPYYQPMDVDDSESSPHLDPEPSKTVEGEDVHAEQGKHEKVECEGFEKTLDPPGAVGVEGNSQAKPHVQQPTPEGCISTTPQASVTKVPFTPETEISNKELDEKIASLKQLAQMTSFAKMSVHVAQGDQVQNKKTVAMVSVPFFKYMCFL